MTRPLIDASDDTLSAIATRSAIAVPVSTFIVRFGTSQNTVTIPSASCSHLKFFKSIFALLTRPWWAGRKIHFGFFGAGVGVALPPPRNLLRKLSALPQGE